MPSSDLKIAIVGCGRIADAHAEIIKGSSHARLTAVCDSELLMAEQLALRFGIAHHYCDFAQMLCAEKPDVVHIATPPASHLALARQAFEAGSHVFVEKPVALNYAETQEMVQAALTHKLKMTAGYINQFDPAAEEMRTLIAAGVIGKPVHLESWCGYNLQGPFGAAILRDPEHWVRRLPGQVAHNVMDHVIGRVAEFITDDEPRVNVMGHWDERAKLHDDLRVMIAGSDVSAYATFSSRVRPEMQFLRVYGTKNTLTLDYVARTVVLQTQPAFPSALGRLTPPYTQAWNHVRAGNRNLGRFLKADLHYFQGLRALLSRFYNCILENKEPPFRYAELLRTAKIMDQIFENVIFEKVQAATS